VYYKNFFPEKLAWQLKISRGATSPITTIAKETKEGSTLCSGTYL
jgi:hypothetical protein